MKIFFNKKLKNKILKYLIPSLIVSSTMNIFAAGFVDVNGDRYYVNDNNSFAINCWRWIDDNNDTVAECYRFGPDGKLVKNATMSDGKLTNDEGQWIDDGIVQRVYTLNFRPLLSNKKNDFNIKSSTESITRINASGVDLPNFIEGDKKPKYPTAVFSPSEAGYVLGKKVALKSEKKPEGGDSSGKILGTDLVVEEDPKYADSGESVYGGIDMSKYVTASNKLTKNVEEAKIWGGEVWNNVMCLSGNGASVKFDVSKYEFFHMEVAHQTHGTSTADTQCSLELYIGKDFVRGYSNFNDGPPEIIDEWLEEQGSNTVELKLVIEGNAKGRKVYIRNARMRYLRDIYKTNKNTKKEKDLKTTN